MDRRWFVRGAAGAFLAPVLPVGALARGSAVAARQDDWVAAARQAIPAATRTRYFQTGGIGPSPRAVIDEVRDRLTFQNRGPADPPVADEMARVEPDLRAHLARSFGSTEAEVALTHSTSESISIVAWSRNWERGDEVVISNQEHPANVVPWYALRDRYGIAIRQIDLRAGTDLLEEIEATLSPRTRLVSISHVSRNNGRALPASESAALGELLRSRGVRYHLDGAQGPGCVPVDFGSLGCDYYSTCGHKWLLGPKGTGALFVREAMLEDTLLSWCGAHSHETMDYEGNYELLPSAARFEFGTRALADFAGLDRAIGWMEEIGMDRILRRIDGLVSHAIDRTARYPELSVSSPTDPDHRSGVFVVRLPEGCDALAMYHALRNETGTLGSPVKWDRDFRLSIHFFNTPAEIDDALDLLADRCRSRIGR